jgi:sulfate adenylyltransferase subunit 1 (EFTu-like GTPase family)
MFVFWALINVWIYRQRSTFRRYMLSLSSGSLEDGGFNPRGVTTQIPNIDIFAADRTSNLT